MDSHDTLGDLARQRSAYRYILLLLLVILVSIGIHNAYVGKLVPAVGALLMMGVLAGNVLLLSTGRTAYLSPTVVVLLSICLVLLSVYFGQNYSLYLLYPLLLALPVLLGTRWAFAIGIVCGSIAIPLTFMEHEIATAIVIAGSMILTWVGSIWLVHEMRRQSRQLHEMANTDPLTGCYNRRFLELQADRHLELWRRYQRRASLLMIDIDHFKRINDRFGHGVGDMAIQGLVRVISARMRSVDTLFRYGGEEFVLLLSETAGDDAVFVAQELCEFIAAADIVDACKLTVSIGVCEIRAAESRDHWLNLADGALYAAKNNGRNRVEQVEVDEVPFEPVGRIVPEWR